MTRDIFYALRSEQRIVIVDILQQIERYRIYAPHGSTYTRWNRNLRFRPYRTVSTKFFDSIGKQRILEIITFISFVTRSRLSFTSRRNNVLKFAIRSESYKNLFCERTRAFFHDSHRARGTRKYGSSTFYVSTIDRNSSEISYSFRIYNYSKFEITRWHGRASLYSIGIITSNVIWLSSAKLWTTNYVRRCLRQYQCLIDCFSSSFLNSHVRQIRAIALNKFSSTITSKQA